MINKFLIILMPVFLMQAETAHAAVSELELRKQIKIDVFKRYSKNDFAGLEKIAHQYRVKKSRTPSGVWKLTFFYFSFVKFVNTDIKSEVYWKKQLERSQAWIDKFPNSPTPYIVHSIILGQYGWKFRGGSYADKVPKKAWKPFHTQLAKAYKVLEKNKNIASKDPHWYTQAINILGPLPYSDSLMEKLLDEGAGREPDYYQTYFISMYYKQPKWGGSVDEIEKFANVVAAYTSAEHGDGLYARIYWYASQVQYGDKLLIESKINWEKMKRGMDDVLAEYPDPWNRNNFAYFSCIAGDKLNTRKLIAPITQDTYIPQVWNKREYFEQCRNWAQTLKI